jgi:hypothetical protein
MTIDFSYPTSLNKVSFGTDLKTYKISINDRPILDISLAFDKRQRGGQGLGKRHKIRELFIDSENRVFAGFIASDRSGSFYQYAPIGWLHVLNEEVTSK